MKTQKTFSGQRGGVYALIKGFPDTIAHAWEDIDVAPLPFDVESIAVVGMGANYNAGLLLKEMLRDEIRVDVFQRPFLSRKNELSVFLSYSGNTKEVVRAFNLSKSEHSLVITSGGTLLELAKKRKIPYIELPPHLHARFTFSECFFPLLRVLGDSGIIRKRNHFVSKVVKTLERHEVQIEREAKKLAISLKDSVPLLYASDFYYPLAYRFQSSLSEDDKILCHSNRITELFHNELEALPSKRFFPMLFLDPVETKYVSKQLSFFKKKIHKYFQFGYLHLTKEERTFVGFYFAYFLGFYLSLLYKNKVPMGETPVSDAIKRQ